MCTEVCLTKVKDVLILQSINAKTIKSMTTYKATIIDDNPMDMLLLEKLISNYCINIEIIGQAQSIEEGIKEIENNRPDIVFLDVMFQDSIIFDFLDKFNLHNVQVIFMTSERKYALNAFGTDAVDFILKPLIVENVILAINKAIKKIKIEGCCAINECSGKSFKDHNCGSDFIAVSSLDKVDFLKMEDVMFCMSEGKYTTFFLFNGKKIVSSKNLGEYEKLLNSSYFYRIHHSYIINIRHLLSIIKKDGSYCELSNNISLPIAKRRQEDFNKFIKLKA